MNWMLMFITLCFGSEVDNAYLDRQDSALLSLYDAAKTQSDSLLVLYRLYPLTQNSALLDRLPEDLDHGATAADLAILSALWAFRIDGAGPLKLISYGRKSMALLRRALEMDRNDPFVLMSEGQSLFYRPEWAGGNKRAALQRFERLRVVLDKGACGLSVLEADMWRWLAASRLGDDAAEELRMSILSRNPPSLVTQFIMEPPS